MRGLKSSERRLRENVAVACSRPFANCPSCCLYFLSREKVPKSDRGGKNQPVDCHPGPRCSFLGCFHHRLPFNCLAGAHRCSMNPLQSVRRAPLRLPAAAGTARSFVAGFALQQGNTKSSLREGAGFVRGLKSTERRLRRMRALHSSPPAKVSPPHTKGAHVSRALPWVRYSHPVPGPGRCRARNTRPSSPSARHGCLLRGCRGC